jgi:hypothetical protein
MRGFSAVAVGIVFGTILAAPSPCQISQQNSASQVQREFTIGRKIADDLERKDGKLEDVAIEWYLQRVSNRVTGAAGKKPLEIHVTRSSKEYAQLLPGTLYLSAGLLEHMEARPNWPGCSLTNSRTAAASSRVRIPEVFL